MMYRSQGQVMAMFYISLNNEEFKQRSFLIDKNNVALSRAGELGSSYRHKIGLAECDWVGYCQDKARVWAAPCLDKEQSRYPFKVSRKRAERAKLKSISRKPVIPPEQTNQPSSKFSRMPAYLHFDPTIARRYWYGPPFWDILNSLKGFGERYWHGTHQWIRLDSLGRLRLDTFSQNTKSLTAGETQTGL